jgi:TonB family protein
VPDIDIFASVTDPTSFGGVREVTGFPDRIAGVTSSAGDPDAPRFAAQVDRVASLKPGNPEPAYPSILRQTRQIGKVMTAFVVDTTGRAVMSTLKIVETSNPLFSEEVRKVLGRYRFNPAEVNGRKVPMHVQLPFDFRLTTDSRGGHREFR